MPDEMKENKREVINLKSGPERWTEGSAFDKIVWKFRDTVEGDTEAYRKIRDLAMGKDEVIPAELRGRLDRNKLTNTQKWGMRLVQLAAQEVVLEREGEVAFPNQMGIGTKIGPEADRLIDGINLFYDGHPTFVIDPSTRMRLEMRKVDDLINMLPSKKTFIGLGVAGLLSVVLAACGGEEKGAGTATQVGGGTGPRSTETMPASPTAQTEIRPTATIAPPEVSPTNIPEAMETKSPQELFIKEKGLDRYNNGGLIFSDVEEEGVTYLADQFGNKWGKYENDVLVVTSDEEKFGHVASKEADYDVKEYGSTDGSKSFGIPAFYTGVYRTEKIRVAETETETEVIRMLYATRNEDGQLVVFENLDGGFLGTANTLTFEFTQQGVQSTDVNGNVLDYSVVDMMLGYNLKLEDVLKAFANKGITLAGLPVEIKLNVSSDADLEKGEELFSTIACDPKDDSYNGRSKCNAVVFRQMTESEKFYFNGGVMPDGQGMKEARDAGTEAIKGYNLGVAFQVDIDKIGGAESVQQLKSELGAQ